MASYYGNSQTNGYNNPNSMNPNGLTNPYGVTNPYGASKSAESSNGANSHSDRGKDESDWFSSAAPPAPAHIMNPYAQAAPTNINANSSNSNANDHSLGNSKINPMPMSTLNSAPNVAFDGPMQQMGGAQTNGGTNSNTITPVPGMEDYDNEPPLLEELGINLGHIRTKSLAVLLPMKYAKSNIDTTIMEDDDLAGPLAFVLLLGGELLLAAKMNFGYIYGLSLFGCFGMTLVLNLLSPTDSISMWTVLSVLGYSLLPVNTLAGLNAFYRIRHMGSFGVVLAVLTIGWCACSSTRLFERGCGLREQRFLVAYPVALFYSAFVMLTIF